MEIDEKALKLAELAYYDTDSRIDVWDEIETFIRYYASRTTAPSDGKAATAEEHEWVTWPRLVAGKPFIICKKCGYTQREDGTSRPCKGHVRVELREVATAEPGEGERPSYIQAARAYAERQPNFLLDAIRPAQPSTALTQEIANYLESSPGNAHADRLLRRALTTMRAEAALTQPPVTDAGKGEREARDIVTEWLGMFDPPPQIDFQQSEMLQAGIAAALSARTEATAEKPLPSSEGDEA